MPQDSPSALSANQPVLHLSRTTNQRYMQYLTEIFQLRIEIQRYINEHVFLPQVVTAISSSPVLSEDSVCVTPNKPITL